MNRAPKTTAGDRGHGGGGLDGGGKQADHDELGQGAAFAPRVQGVDVQAGRVVDPAYDVVEQDVGVLEEPGEEDETQGNACETGIGGDGQEQREGDDDPGGAAAGGAKEVGDYCVQYLA